MHKCQTIIRQQILDLGEVSIKLPNAHMLKHAHGHDAVKRPLHIAVVDQLKRHPPLKAAQLGLLLRQRQLLG